MAVSMRKYFAEWLRAAFTHGLSVSDLWASIIAAGLGILDHYLPAAKLMTTYAWQIPIWSLAAVMALRLIMAPYWIAQKKVAETALLKSKVDEFSATRTRLEVRIADGAPYAVTAYRWLHRRSGLFNAGPAVAENVSVSLGEYVLHRP